MIKHLIRLQGVLGIGSIKALKVLDYFGNAENAFKASEEERKKSGIFSASELKRFNKADEAMAEKIISECKNHGIELIPFGGEDYPNCLRVLDNPPLVLYVKGEMPDFDNAPCISIVGPRKVSEYGEKAAYSLANRLTRAGFTVVSGGAVGADYYAHFGALKAGGKTTLVYACGIECGYLKENEALRRHVAENGCIISEHPPYIKPTKYSFVVRNRLIAALSYATVVVEAGKKSGALNTAGHAASQGREVFVIPGSPTSEEYAGSNALLRDGARPLLDVTDILNEYLARYADKIDINAAYQKPDKKQTESKSNPENREKAEQNVSENKEKQEIYKKLSIETLSNNAKIVYNCIDRQKFYPEDIKTEGLNGAEILSALTELEIEMYIRALPGGRYEILD